MGGKHAGEGKQVHFCVAVLIFLAVAGCALGPVTTKVEDPGTHLALGRTFFAEGDYANALRQDELAASLAPGRPVAQEALLYMGLIYAYPANPKRDYARSAAYFKAAAEGYPKSPSGQQAKIMAAVLHQTEELSRTVERLTATNAELSRTAEKLSATIEALTKVDMGIERKRKRGAP